MAELQFIVFAHLAAHVNQRPGLDPRDYSSRADYRADGRAVTRDLRDFRVLLGAAMGLDVTDQDLRAAFGAYGGRLTLVEHDGGMRLEYCTGQYWPVEYRRAACAVLAHLLWSQAAGAYSSGDGVRAYFRRRFGRGVAGRWFK